MKEELSVFLRMGRSPHGVYQDLIRYPPEKVKYVVDSGQREGNASAGREPLLHKAKLFAWGVASNLVVAAAPVNARDADLVHSTNNFLPITRTPWVVDSEHVWGMVGFRTKRLGSPYYRWQLRRLLGSEKCRGILAWSDAAAMTFHHAFGEKIAKKVRTVRPAIGPRPVRVRKSGAKKFLFIGYRFEEKGGRDLLEAFDLASRKADIELTVISNVPEHYLHKYRRHKDIRFELPKYSHKELTEKFYGKSDCLVFPTYVDSFGMVALEALGHGMPVISSDCFALPEMVRHGHNGLVVPLPFAYYGKDGLFREVEYASWQDYLSRIGRTRDETFIQALADNILELAQDSKLCARLSKNAAADSRKGFLSIGTRNRLLRQNYDSALAR